MDYEDYECRSVDIARINDDDTTYKISTSSSAAAIATSIGRIGLVQPPIVVPSNSGSGYTVLSGFARIQACRQLGWTRLPVRSPAQDTPLSRCALIAIADSLSQRPLNVVEQARAVYLLTTTFDRPADLFTAAQAIGFTINPQLTKKLLVVRQLGPQLQEGLIDGTIGLPTALRIHAMVTPDLAGTLGQFVRELNLSLTRQKELLDWVETITRREDISITTLLAENPLAHWRSDAQMEGPQRSSLIRRYLKKRCYPTIAAFEAQYSETLKKVGFSKGLQLSPPQNFEGRTFILRMEFSDSQELSQRLKEVERLCVSTAFGELIDPCFEV